MRMLAVATLAALTLASPAWAEFTISFTWGDIPLCTSGRPNRVDSPQFVLKDVPQGTRSIDFRLKDLDAPGYNHGGGKVSVSGDGVIPAGAFTYKSPCPPNGVHTYEWRATAKDGGKTLGKATAQRRYPE